MAFKKNPKSSLAQTPKQDKSVLEKKAFSAKKSTPAVKKVATPLKSAMKSDKKVPASNGKQQSAKKMPFKKVVQKPESSDDDDEEDDDELDLDDMDDIEDEDDEPMPALKSKKMANLFMPKADSEDDDDEEDDDDDDDEDLDDEDDDEEDFDDEEDLEDEDMEEEEEEEVTNYQVVDTKKVKQEKSSPKKAEKAAPAPKKAAAKDAKPAPKKAEEAKAKPTPKKAEASPAAKRKREDDEEPKKESKKSKLEEKQSTLKITEANERKTLFVRNLAPKTTEKELAAISSDAITARIPKKLSTTKKTSWFGFLEFKDEADADKNLELLKGKELKGRAIEVDYTGAKSDFYKTKAKKDNLNPKKLHVQGINTKLSKQQLNQYFPGHAEVKQDSLRDKSLYINVSFNSAEEAAAVLAKSNTLEVNGEIGTIMYARTHKKKNQKKKQRQQKKQQQQTQEESDDE